MAIGSTVQGTMCFSDYDIVEQFFSVSYRTSVSWLYYMMNAVYLGGVQYEHGLLLIAVSGLIQVVSRKKNI